MVYITGDTHGDFRGIVSFCSTNRTKKSDIMIILGDVGINYYQNARDIELKEFLKRIPITLFCIHGNHECRPQNIATYKEKQWCGGKVLYEEKYPDFLFPKDGETFNINGEECLIIGGACSVDKDFRIANGWAWWPDEQPSDEIKHTVESRLAELDYKIDVIMSHTCPLKYEPVESFFRRPHGEIDKSTEEWLEKIEAETDYKRWYCGHFHIEKKIDNMIFLFNDIVEF